MIELSHPDFSVTLFGVDDAASLPSAGSADFMVTLPAGGRFAGTAYSLDDLRGQLAEGAAYLSVTDAIVLPELREEPLMDALADLVRTGELENVLIEVLEEVEVEEE